MLLLQEKKELPDSAVTLCFVIVCHIHHAVIIPVFTEFIICTAVVPSLFAPYRPTLFIVCQNLIHPFPRLWLKRCILNHVACRAMKRDIIGSRPSDHYFRSVCWFVCLFVCAEFFSAVLDPITIKLGHMLYVWV